MGWVISHHASALAVRSTGLIKPTFRTWIAYGQFTHESPPRPTYRTNLNFSLNPTHPTILVGKMPMRSKFGAGLESGFIKPVARTVWGSMALATWEHVRAVNVSFTTND